MPVELPDSSLASVAAGWIRLEEGTPIACRQCDEPLEIHQPDAYNPDRWLGTCHSCGSWHVIGIREDGRHAVVVLLPLNDLIVAAIRTGTDELGPAPKKTREQRD